VQKELTKVGSRESRGESGFEERGTGSKGGWAKQKMKCLNVAKGRAKKEEIPRIEIIKQEGNFFGGESKGGKRNIRENVIEMPCGWKKKREISSSVGGDEGEGEGRDGRNMVFLHGNR